MSEFLENVYKMISTSRIFLFDGNLNSLPYRISTIQSDSGEYSILSNLTTALVKIINMKMINSV